jgi:hypothetical protein
MDQLFSLGHVSAAPKSALTWRSNQFWRTDHQHVSTQVRAREFHPGADRDRRRGK